MPHSPTVSSSDDVSGSGDMYSGDPLTAVGLVIAGCERLSPVILVEPEVNSGHNDAYPARAEHALDTVLPREDLAGFDRSADHRNAREGENAGPPASRIAVARGPPPPLRAPRMAFFAEWRIGRVLKRSNPRRGSGNCTCSRRRRGTGSLMRPHCESRATLRTSGVDAGRRRTSLAALLPSRPASAHGARTVQAARTMLARAHFQ